MTAEEAISYIENYGWSTTRLGLGRTRELLEALGNPQKKLKFIHVAGSNGKGSACAMFDAILRQAGYKCGLYTSPYIEDFCERIQINGENIPGERLALITERVMQLAERMEDHPSQFELVTAIAMQYYFEEECDIVVLEVGMGGALDSTNVIDAPELACITNIGLEHTEYLGDTLEEIARTKAGIIKPGCSCVCYDGAPEVTAVIREVCASFQVPLACVDFSRLRFLSGNLDGQRFLWRTKTAFSPVGKKSEAAGKPAGHNMEAEISQADPHTNTGSEQEDKTSETEYQLALIGKHQLHNAALVLTGIEVLKEKGWEISGENIRRGLQTVKWPARLEVLMKDPLVLLDGGHNPQCAEALIESLDQLLPEKKVIFLAGVLRDKEYDKITELMIPYAEKFVCVTPLSDRALTAAEFAEYIEGKGVKACACDSIEKGIVTALAESMTAAQALSEPACEDAALNEGRAFCENENRGNLPVVIFGSLYLAGAARSAFHAAYRKALRKVKIKARDSLAPEIRKAYSEEIVRQILKSEAYKNAETIMIYNAVRGEVSLESLKEPAERDGKTLVYPYCVDKETMIALKPSGPEGFQPGAFGIPEPVPEKSETIAPEQIDLVLCPCTSFDCRCNRMGMGAGYYDRFLEKCVNAKIAAVAFEAQRASRLPVDPWDKPMEIIFTENAVYLPQ